MVRWVFSGIVAVPLLGTLAMSCQFGLARKTARVLSNDALIEHQE